MADYNRVIMIGNLTRDPEYKTLASGQPLCRLGLASNRQFKNRQTGTMVQEVCYVDIDVWGAQAESCRQYLQKGRAVLVEGRLKFDTWEDQNGQTRSKHVIVADRVVFLSQASAESAESVSSQNIGAAQKDPNEQLEKELLDQIDDIKKRTAAKAEVKPAIKEQTVEPAVKEAKPKAAPAKAAPQAEQKNDAAPLRQSSGQAPAGVEFKDEPPFQDDLPF